MKHLKRYFWLGTYFVFIWLVSATFIAWWTQKGLLYGDMKPAVENFLPYGKRESITEEYSPYSAEYVDGESKLSADSSDRRTYLETVKTYFPTFFSFIVNTVFSLWIVYITERFREYLSKRKRKKKRIKK